MEASTYTQAEPAVEIRFGVFRPDWSAVTKPRAREALAGRRAARAGLLDKWSHKLEANDDLVWRTILRLYGNRGRPPQIQDIADATRFTANHVATVLRTLQSRDLIELDGNSANIRLAYPFTEAATGHRVKLNGHTLSALCAIDALGVAEMYGADISISSPCSLCGSQVDVTTAAEGRSLHSVTPSGAVVWYDFAYDGSAAASCCPAIVFFCSGEHLEQWLNAQTPRHDGIRLTMDEALEVGRAIFGPVLALRAP
jgi:alkylmercury lyase